MIHILSQGEAGDPVDSKYFWIIFNNNIRSWCKNCVSINNNSNLLFFTELFKRMFPLTQFTDITDR